MENVFYREIINSDLINLDLPEELKHREIELIIFPYEDEKKSEEEIFGKVQGIWKGSDIDLEKIRKKAWER